MVDRRNRKSKIFFCHSQHANIADMASRAPSIPRTQRVANSPTILHDGSLHLFRYRILFVPRFTLPAWPLYCSALLESLVCT